MFGFIHESIRLLMIRKYGEDFWDSVLERSGFEKGKENLQNHYYSDDDTFSLIDSVSAISKLPTAEVWEMYGQFLVEYTMALGWDELMTSLSADLKGFLDTLDALHYFIDHVVFKANLTGPSFRCESNDDGSLTLHYISARSGLYPIVKGVLRYVAKRVFKQEISITVSGRSQRMVHTATGEKSEEHVIFIINTADGNLKSEGDTGSNTSSTHSMCTAGAKLRMNGNDFGKTFPYHIIIDEDCKVRHCGMALGRYFPSMSDWFGTPLVRLFSLQRPQIALDFENIINFINSVFVLECRTSASAAYEVDTASTESRIAPLRLKELLSANLRINSIPLHDNTRDMILLNQQRISEVEMNNQLKESSDKLAEMGREIAEQKHKGEILLHEVLPASVAAQLKEGKSVDASAYPSATVLFSDVPNFQYIVPATGPKHIVTMLNDLFTRFDRLVELHEVYKVETIGDSYMIVCGAPEAKVNHCETVCYVALGMLQEALAVTDPLTKEPLEVRVGIHTGSIVTGVVGKRMPRYCLFGDTVNTASRMESHSLPRRIHCTEAVHEKANETGRFTFFNRGMNDIKGKGWMNTYFLLDSKKKSLWEIIGRQRDENVHSIDGFQDVSKGLPDLGRNSPQPSVGRASICNSVVVQTKTVCTIV